MVLCSSSEVGLCCLTGIPLEASIFSNCFVNSLDFMVLVVLILGWFGFQRTLMRDMMKSRLRRA